MKVIDAIDVINTTDDSNENLYGFWKEVNNYQNIGRNSLE